MPWIGIASHSREKAQNEVVQGANVWTFLISRLEEINFEAKKRQLLKKS